MLVYSFLVDKKSSQYEEKNSAKTFYEKKTIKIVDIQYSLLRHINCVLLDFNLSPIFFLDIVYIDFALRCDTDKINSPSSDFYSYLEQNYQIDCFKNLGFFPPNFRSMKQTMGWIAGRRMSRTGTSKICSLPYWTKTKIRNCPQKNSTCSNHGGKYPALLGISITDFGPVKNHQSLNPVGTHLIDTLGILLSKINSAKEVHIHFQLKKNPYSICLKSATYKNRPFFE